MAQLELAGRRPTLAHGAAELQSPEGPGAAISSSCCLRARETPGGSCHEEPINPVDARFWVGQEESLERKYRVEPGRSVLTLFQQAGRSLVADLGRLSAVEPTSGTRAVAQRVLGLNTSYLKASYAMFRAVDGHRSALVLRLDHDVGDPVFGQIQAIVYRNLGLASRTALDQSARLRRDESAATNAIAIAFGLGLFLLLVFALIIARFRRRLDAARLTEVRRLSELAVTDPLTRLRNHRAFQEDLAASVHRVGRIAFRCRS